MSTHNLCFRAKISKKKVYPCTPQFYYVKVGCKGYESHGHVILMLIFVVSRFGFERVNVVLIAPVSGQCSPVPFRVIDHLGFNRPVELYEPIARVLKFKMYEATRCLIG